jgi:polyphosphate kinase
VVVHDPPHGERFARLKVENVFPRLVRIPSEDKVEEYAELGLIEVLANNFVWLEEVIAANLDMLFPEVDIVAAYPFRITRDADLEIKDD